MTVMQSSHSTLQLSHDLRNGFGNASNGSLESEMGVEITDGFRKEVQWSVYLAKSVDKLTFGSSTS